MPNIIAWIILGLVAGAIAKGIYPGEQGGGFVATTTLGILGAIVGGFLGQLVLGTSAIATSGVMTFSSFAFGVLGSLVILYIWGMFNRQKA